VRKFANNVDRFVVTPLIMQRECADLLHVVDPGNTVYLPRIRHRCSIVTVHDTIPYLARDGKLPGWRPTRTGRWLMNRIVSQLAEVDRIVCVSQATKRDLLSLVATPEERVRVIHNAIFQPMHPARAEEKATLRHRLGLPVDAPVILHVGRNFYKNREAVIDAFSKLRRRRRDARLVFVGALSPAQRDLVVRDGLSDAMHVLDHVPAETMPALYSLASALLFPSLYEGFGYPVIEAQLCGTPVICSTAGSLPEVAGAGAVLVAPEDVDGMAEAAVKLFEDRDAKNALIEAGRINAARFDRETWFDAHARLYQEILGGRSPLMAAA
jgi:glycosyltransferase involved in cell wall biosynthesis